MSEVKTVKVDNWGSFFLQKLQNFFNKTDYCDLTLQFRDNSQLKVHRLVLSACTDFFNQLESTSESIYDVLIMPRDLQADVVVPIVNFMYTGTLEFEIRMYDRLLKTARDMKMSVLLKLLEAHRRAMPQKPPPVLLNPGVAGRTPLRGRGRPVGSVYNKRASLNSSADEPSEFERLRRAGNENPTGKRPINAVTGRAASPLEKKPNLQDVKEYTEAARLRKELNADGDEDLAGDYDVDDNYSQSSGDEATPRQSVSLLSTSAGSNANRASTGSASGTTTTTATVTLKETPGQKIDHAKIISEVMKKYPHLLKSNKNIKLKITQKTPGVSGTSFTVQAEATPANATASASTPVGRALMASKQQQQLAKPAPGAATRSLITAKPTIVGQSIIKPVAGTSSGTAAPKPNPAVKGNRIDSKTMHKLIAMGAENTEGPWLCLRCGVDGKPIGIPSYKAFRKHLINMHGEKIDPRLCEHCGRRSKNRQEMYHHVQVSHGIMPPQGVAFPVCRTCKYVAIDHTDLAKHEKEKKHGHAVAKATFGAAAGAASASSAASAPAKKTGAEMGNEFGCTECERSFLNRKALTMHVNVKHRGINKGRRAKKVDSEEEETEEEEDDEEEEEDDEEEVEGADEDDEDQVDFDKALPEDVDYVPTKAVARKIKVLSNVTVKGKSRSSEAESLSTVATGIATSLGLGAEEGAAEADAAHAEYTEDGEEIVDETRLIEEAMADVHGEGEKADAAADVETKFLAEDGSELELTHAQKVDLLSQLESNGSAEDVVMMYEGDESAAGSALAADSSVEEVFSEATPGQVIKDGDEVLMVYGGPRKDGKESKRADEGETAATKPPTTTTPKEVAEPVAEEDEDVSIDAAAEENEDDELEEKVLKEKNSIIKELEGDWADEGEKTEDEEASAVVKAEAKELPDLDEKMDVEKGEEESATKAPSEDAKAKTSEGAEQSKKEAAESLPEFMNDWDDDN